MDGGGGMREQEELLCPELHHLPCLKRLSCHFCAVCVYKSASPFIGSNTMICRILLALRKLIAAPALPVMSSFLDLGWPGSYQALARLRIPPHLPPAGSA